MSACRKCGGELAPEDLQDHHLHMLPDTCIRHLKAELNAVLQAAGLAEDVDVGRDPVEAAQDLKRSHHAAIDEMLSLRDQLASARSEARAEALEEAAHACEYAARACNGHYEAMTQLPGDGGHITVAKAHLMAGIQSKWCADRIRALAKVKP